MPKLGQHFLKNQSALRLIVESLALKPHDTVVEIGPGHGELTGNIKELVPSARIIAIEKDSNLIKKLQEKFKDDKNIEIIEGDALQFSSLVSNLQSPIPFKITGNIPYYITGHLLRIISELDPKPECCVFTIQKEVAERIVEQPPRMNRLAASVQFWAEPKILKILPATDFKPAPKVDSAIIELVTRHGQPLVVSEKYYAAVRTIFTQPRKTVLNNLAGRKINKGEIIEILKKIGIKSNARPQDLSIKNIEAISLGISSW
jgi:16S rRNA (adenine1518-N6/adenine1519-N6)-dimethyltransferase